MCFFMVGLLSGLSRHRGAHSLHRVRGWVRDTGDVVFVRERLHRAVVAAAERPGLGAGAGRELGEGALVDGVGEDQRAVFWREPREQLTRGDVALGVVGRGAVLRGELAAVVTVPGERGAAGVEGLVHGHAAEECDQRRGVVGVGAAGLHPGEGDALEHVVDGDAVRVADGEHAADRAAGPGGEVGEDRGEGVETTGGEGSVHRRAPRGAGVAARESSEGGVRRLCGGVTFSTKGL
ncbi:MAG: hypothetical protein R3A52_24635 [Polyangiales bacterium]